MTNASSEQLSANWNPISTLLNNAALRSPRQHLSHSMRRLDYHSATLITFHAPPWLSRVGKFVSAEGKIPTQNFLCVAMFWNLAFSRNGFIHSWQPSILSTSPLRNPIYLFSTREHPCIFPENLHGAIRGDRVSA